MPAMRPERAHVLELIEALGGPLTGGLWNALRKLSDSELRLLFQYVSAALVRPPPRG